MIHLHEETYAGFEVGMETTPPDHRTLGSAIRLRRIELNLTQEALADRIGGGLRQSEISRLERDIVTLPRRARLEALATALELRVGELLARSGWTGADLVIEPRQRGHDEFGRALSAMAPTASFRYQAVTRIREPDVGALKRLRLARTRSTELAATYRKLEARSALLLDVMLPDPVR
jgi:transcriptional regulator with XRE-family HTH domain